MSQNSFFTHTHTLSTIPLGNLISQSNAANAKTGGQLLSETANRKK